MQYHEICCSWGVLVSEVKRINSKRLLELVFILDPKITSQHHISLPCLRIFFILRRDKVELIQPTRKPCSQSGPSSTWQGWRQMNEQIQHHPKTSAAQDRGRLHQRRRRRRGARALLLRLCTFHTDYIKFCCTRQMERRHLDWIGGNWATYRRVPAQTGCQRHTLLSCPVSHTPEEQEKHTNIDRVEYVAWECRAVIAFILRTVYVRSCLCCIPE